MYYIYHILGVKIGVSKYPKKRVNNQKHTEYEILETHTCIYEVSKREIELQKQYGYPIDKTPYYISSKILKKHRRPDLGGKGNSIEEMKRKRSLVKVVGHPPSIPILVFKDNEFIKEYPSLSECARDIKVDKGNIYKVCRGIYKQCNGYKFEYKQ